jgi:hypothetical protein
MPMASPALTPEVVMPILIMQVVARGDRDGIDHWPISDSDSDSSPTLAQSARLQSMASVTKGTGLPGFG